MMTKRNEVYLCELCGNVVEVVVGAEGAPECCSQAMVLKEAKTADAATEKHVPVVEDVEGGSKVLVGSTPHPMTAEHQICWIEIINGNYVNRRYLKPGEEPMARFYVKAEKGAIVREYCNVHGLWEYVVD
jgi:superoxide reductase